MLRDGDFENIWIQPAAGDAGGRLGAALAAYYHSHRPCPANQCEADPMSGAFLGPHSLGRDRKPPPAAGAKFTAFGDRELSSSAPPEPWPKEGRRLVSGAHGIRPARAGQPFDPRAIPVRQPCKSLNLEGEYRESFRPFAPSVLREDVAELVRNRHRQSLHAAGCRRRRTPARTMTERGTALFGIEKLNVPRSEIPAVTHVDYSARVQTVDRETNPRYHALISRSRTNRLPGAGEHEF